MILTTIVIFLIVLAALIFVHELGHFIAARSFGIRVDEFALGFGPKIWKKKKGETTYSIGVIPFGGFVKIFGEDPDAVSTSGPDSSRSFVNVARWKQAVILCSGVLGNFIFAWLLVTIALSIGAAASPEDYPQYANRMTDQHIVIDSVVPGSPADKAGVMAGDTIIAISSPVLPDATSNLTTVDVESDVQMAAAGAPMIVSLIRDDKPLSVTIKAAQGIIPGEPDQYAIGISMEDAATLKLPFYLAAYESVRFTWSLMQEIVVGFGTLIAGLFQGTSSVSDLTGPVGIAGMVGTAARMGFSYLLLFTAFISVNLGIINLVPFPALDGGRLLFVAIEAVIRRPIKAAFANVANTIGFVLLMVLMVFVTYKDIMRLFIHP